MVLNIRDLQCAFWSPAKWCGIFRLPLSICLYIMFQKKHPLILLAVSWGVPYILAYKPEIFSWILTLKLWGSAYTRVIAQQLELARHGQWHGPLVGTCRPPTCRLPTWQAAGPHANCCCSVCIPVRRLALWQVDASPDVRVRAGCVGVRRRNRGLCRLRRVTMHRSRVLIRRRLPLPAYTRVTSFC